jgi:hypothetical protein
VAAEAARIEAAGRGGCGEVGCHRLRKVFGHGAGATVAVRRLSFGVHTGECLALLGPNGAGKSSTMLMLSGEVHPPAHNVPAPPARPGTNRTHISSQPRYKPDAHLFPPRARAQARPSGGDAFVAGHSVHAALLAALPHVGLCAQSDTLWEHLSPREHLRLALALAGVAPPAAVEREVRPAAARLLQSRAPARGCAPLPLSAAPVCRRRAPPPLPSRTNWTRLVPRPVLNGHAPPRAAHRRHTNCSSDSG